MTVVYIEGSEEAQQLSAFSDEHYAFFEAPWRDGLSEDDRAVFTVSILADRSFEVIENPWVVLQTETDGYPMRTRYRTVSIQISGTTRMYTLIAAMLPLTAELLAGIESGIGVSLYGALPSGARVTGIAKAFRNVSASSDNFESGYIELSPGGGFTQVPPGAAVVAGGIGQSVEDLNSELRSTIDDFAYASASSSGYPSPHIEVRHYAWDRVAADSPVPPNETVILTFGDGADWTSGFAYLLVPPLPPPPPPPPPAPDACQEIGRVTRAYVSAYDRAKVHLSRLFRYERRCMVANINGAVPASRRIVSATWRVNSPEVAVMSEPRIAENGREAMVMIRAQLGGYATMRVDATLDNGEVYNQVFRLDVREASIFFSDSGIATGPTTLTVTVESDDEA